ncbi:hypothetical protein [Lignipirellula cremea]|uniref:Uncharacterized protein n=1 Tax=Lignipirellula cremea TaxID=2528010 RepID=A0A518DUZ0_9BACT|nr:hypothetical protein [Lignipirellula cremea]QDU95655.1 hypothetical protein Pla8534_34710 [Lignipirellula cremea]
MTEPDPPRVRAISEPIETPVFRCQLLVSRNEQGQVTARCANLRDVAGQGESERMALQRAVAAFKAVAVQHEGKKDAMPWIDPPLAPEPGELERFLAVHL